jgi:hypothetical protein
MPTDPDGKTIAATNLLGRMLAGVAITANARVSELEPDLSLAAITSDPDSHSVQTVIVLPSGDHYRVTVGWLPEESP